MHCGFDPSGYFAVDPASLNMLPEGSPNEAFSISLEECIVHVTSDEHAIMRIGCGAKSFQVLDQRKALPFNEFVRVEGPCETSTNIWADLSFGLQHDGNDLESGALAMPFQATVFMTPGWTLVNLGVERLSSVMANLTPVWIILDYFSKYFSSEAFGNPYFEAVSSKETLKRKLESAAKCNRPSARNPTLNLEFRLWLLRPMLCIPSDTTKIDAPTLRVKSNSGFWYRFKSLDSYTSQEMGSTNLSIQFSSEFQTPDMCRDGLSWRDTGIHNRAKQLVDGLSFGLRVDLNGETKHADYALCLPMWQHLIDKPTDRCRVSSSELEVRPVELPRPTVCTPATTIKRDLGMSFCEITVVVEVLPQASTIIFAFLGFGTDADDELTNADLGGNEEDSTISPEPSFTINARVESLRFFIIDPTLGVHLPLAVFSLSILKLSISRLGIKNDTPRLSNGDSHPSDLHLIVETTFWADYFKLGATRSWEPLIEPFVCLILYEKSVCRGEGLTLNSDHPFHVNVTGALLLTLEDAIASLSRAVAETFVDAKFEKKETKLQPMKEKPLFVEQVLATGDRNLEIDHQVPEPLNPDERIAFSLMNLTGQRIRIHQLLERIETKEHNASLVTYLEHSEATRLELQATVSVIQNLHLVEVPFPGLPHSPRETGSEVSTSHSVDIQLPGFKWIEGISVDTSGRRFDHIVPRSPLCNRKFQMIGDWETQ
ncbi:SHR-binding domain of vacuolar-sorting associated protein 13 [Fragilaria crotonensis]|nr:SHR-binding domain of vacuolar-sorting associated protein 13 [Fragilaria crotonensis]